jgi:cytochrome c-type biogenesis protein CcmH/NrfG
MIIKIKFNPMDGDCWNTLGHVLWKKKDLPAAKKAFDMAL